MNTPKPDSVEIETPAESSPESETDFRASGIGGGDIAAIAGLSPWRTPFDVWLDKTRRSMVRVVTEEMRMGTLLEPTIANLYEEQTKKTLTRWFTKGFRREGNAIQIGHPDGITQERVIFEAKNVGAHRGKLFGEEWTDEVPEDALLQVQWYLSLMSVDEGHLAALIGGNRFRIYRIQRDRELEDWLLETAAKFWRDHVEKDTPPLITDSENARAWLRETFPRDTIAVRPATDLEVAHAAEYRKIDRAYHELEKRRDDAAIQFKALIGDAAGIDGPGFRITYRAAKSGGTDWKGLALFHNPTDELLAEFARPGTRRLLTMFDDEVIPHDKESR